MRVVAPRQPDGEHGVDASGGPHVHGGQRRIAVPAVPEQVVVVGGNRGELMRGVDGAGRLDHSERAGDVAAVEPLPVKPTEFHRAMTPM
jgi:hypothetical protein